MNYEPDAQDEIVGDALAVGGLAFVEELHAAAAAAAGVVCGWDGDGPEPPGYRQAWIAAARRLVSERQGHRQHVVGEPPSSEPYPVRTGGPLVLEDTEIEALRPGDRVVVRRYLPAADDRPEQIQQWLVEIAEIHRWAAGDGWSIVPAPDASGEDPRGLPIDIHVGITGHGIRTELHRPGQEPAS